jgi:hypothetical protein
MPDKLELQLSYLYNSITDIQGVIRAIDTKLNYLLVILIIPLTKLNGIYSIAVISNKKAFSYQILGYLSVLILIIFVLSWLFAFVLAMRGIIGIDNPVNHVSGTRPKGTFYGGYLYKVTFLDTLINRNIQSACKLEEHLPTIPADMDAIRKELIFEQMKLIYIRTIKMARQYYAFIFGAIWIVCGGMVWLTSLAL